MIKENDPCSVLSMENTNRKISVLEYLYHWKNGLESIVDVQLNEAEQEKFNQSAAAVKTMNEALKDVLK